MHCKHCGKEVAETAETCAACGRELKETHAPSKEIVGKVKARSKDAMQAFKIFAVNPVGGLARSFECLEKRQAMEVGIVFAVTFAACVLIGAYIGLPKWIGKPSFGDMMKLLISALVPFVSIAGASALARKVFRGAGSLEGDVFVAGASPLPPGFLILIGGVLGMANIEVIAILGVFALSYTILILYTGCTQISKIPDVGAAPAVPIIILISGWLSKVLFAAML